MSGRPVVGLATRNAGKLREIRAILASAGVELAQPDESWVAPPEDGETYLENARIKAHSLARASGRPALADDSGIEVDALGGEPGPRSARFAGDDASDEANLSLMIARVDAVAETARTARYRCLAVLAHPSGKETVAEGVVEGRLIVEPRGSGGFGYDPLFVPEGEDRTMAELDAVAKDRISHRGRAFRALIPALESLGASDASGRPTR